MVVNMTAVVAGVSDNLVLWVPVGTAVLSAVLASFGTYLVTDRTVKAASVEAERQRQFDAHQRALDREHSSQLEATDRRQRRIEDAYGPIRKFVGEANEYAIELIRSSYGTQAISRSRPELSSDEAVIADLHSSDKVSELFQEVCRELSVLEIDAEQVAFVKNLGDPLPLEWRSELMDAVRARRETESRLFAAFAALNAQLRTELDSKGSVHPNGVV